MLNCGTIERETCVITYWMCLMAATSWWAYGQSLQLQELLCSLLTEIMKKGLTTIFLPHAFRMRHFYYRTFFRMRQLALATLSAILQIIYILGSTPPPSFEILPGSHRNTVVP